jgi:hypothetical protein
MEDIDMSWLQFAKFWEEINCGNRIVPFSATLRYFSKVIQAVNPKWKLYRVI